MNRVARILSLLAIVAGFILISTFTLGQTSYAQSDDTIMDEINPSDQANTSIIPLPPTTEDQCADAGGTWRPTGSFCRGWNGEADYGQHQADQLGITNQQECEDRDGRIVRDFGGDAQFASYLWCRAFTGEAEFIAQIEASNEEAALGGATEGDGVPKECDTGAMGWAICPLTNAIASTIDSIYSILVTFVQIEPFSTSGKDTQIYDIWVIFRNMANIVFVLFLLIVLISQISNLGMSNYGVKRMLPRIIAAAVLVNVSIYICQIAIDISNIVGQSTYELLITVADNVGIGNTNGGDVWASVAMFFLSGGAVAAGIMTATGPGALGGIGLIIVPIVLMAAMAAFTAFIILAMRYILVYLLTIVSPLAFVAYLLPNTSKYFDKWKDIFITILFFYPLFSVLFGAAALIGRITMSAADLTHPTMGPLMLLFGLFIQVAPLVMSYKLLQTANSVAGTITNGMQSRGAGMISAAKARRDKHLQESTKANVNRMKSYGATKGPNTRNPIARTGRALSGLSRRRSTTEKQREFLASRAESDQMEWNANDTSFSEADRRARSAAIGVSESRAKAQSEFIRELANRDDLAQIAAGGSYNRQDLSGMDSDSRRAIELQNAALTQSATQQAKVQQQAEERKVYKAEFEGSTIGQLETALRNAISSGDVSKTQALQSLLYGSGGGGVSAVKRTIQGMESGEIKSNSGAPIGSDSEIVTGMKQNILSNHGDMKGRDNAQMEWAFNNKSIESIAGSPSFGSLSDKDKATQSPDNLRAMYESGTLDQSTAERILSNPNMSTGLKPEQRDILESVKAGQPVKSPGEYNEHVEALAAQAKSTNTSPTPTSTTTTTETTNQNQGPNQATPPNQTLSIPRDRPGPSRLNNPPKSPNLPTPPNSPNQNQDPPSSN